MMGGVGFVKETPVEKFYRDSKIGVVAIVNSIVTHQPLLQVITCLLTHYYT